MNMKKTKFMIVSKSTNIDARLVINNQNIERVDKYTYLGTWLNNQNDSFQEIRIRIETACSTFTSIKQLVSNKNLILPLRICIVCCYVYPVVILYANLWLWKLGR